MKKRALLLVVMRPGADAALWWKAMIHQLEGKGAHTAIMWCYRIWHAPITEAGMSFAAGEILNGRN